MQMLLTAEVTLMAAGERYNRPWRMRTGHGPVPAGPPGPGQAGGGKFSRPG